MPTPNIFEQAAAELLCAADVAEERALGNPLDPWSAIAGTIRLIAAGLFPMQPQSHVRAKSIQEHLAGALTTLDQGSSRDELRDFTFWRAHVVDLSSNVKALEAGQRPAREGS